MALAPGSRVGAYEIRALIGAGGMGEVYRATDPRLKRDVAIKVLPAAFARDPERMRRFELEAQAAGRLNHPNILAVYDLGSHQGSPYLVSELLEGESLRSRLCGGKLAPQRALDYARQIASGLAAAHAAGIVHRDLKPENLYLTRDGRVKILDFGLAKLTPMPSETRETQTLGTSPGTVLGTVAYMSPEQIRGQAVDHRSDIFSFGCVLHEMLSGEQPFKGPSSADTMSATLTQERPELGISGSFAAALDRIVGHCLEKHPEERFQSAQDLAFGLASISEVSQTGSVPAAPRRRWKRLGLAAALVVLAVAFGAFFLGRLSAPSVQPAFQRLTFRRGVIDAARFAPDGRTIVYSATWEDEPGEIFTVRLESPESRPLGFPGAGLLALSRSGELAVALKPSIGHSPFVMQGLLARVPFSGGSPRPIENRIAQADWSPDGRELALVRETATGMQLEYPPGTVLHRTAGAIASPRMSPSGQLIAFVDHPMALDLSGALAVVDLSGRLNRLAEFNVSDHLAWSPNGKEIWISGALSGSRQDLWAVTLGGSRRLLLRQSTNIVIHDVASDGRVLIANQALRQRMFARSALDGPERELSWLDWSLPTGISSDGKLIVFTETGEGAGDATAAYVRETSGAPAIKLGAGGIATFSADGQFVVAIAPNSANIFVYPIGPGPTRQVRLKGFSIAVAGLLRDGRSVWFDGNEPSHGRRIYVTGFEGQPPRPVSPEGAQVISPFTTPDGKHFLVSLSGRMALIPVEGGEPEMLPGVEPGERTAGCAADGRAFFVFKRGDSPARVYRVDRATGRRQFLREIGPAERAGIGRSGTNLHMTPAGGYVYSTFQDLSELYLVTGLR